ncbi:MAG TPA: methylated-DNA--[protein]-cysteine S-methyltransferase [Methylomirabilota bacterium]|nr:methylated-DNA--[protein]-cysteine S-methyltransferase [Methylomirabilota bacterium]
MFQAPATDRTTEPTSRITRPDSRVTAVQRACRYIEARVDGTDCADGRDETAVVTLAELGEHCGLSPWHLQRLFKRTMGVSPRQYADAHRMKRFKAGLQQGGGVAAATYDAGYGSSSRVYERAAAALGMTPATYAKGGRGAQIAYAVTKSPLGLLLVAATGQGICFVSIGARNEDLETALQREFPAADTIRRDDDALAEGVARILGHLNGKEPHVDLPLDIRATAFQRRVWEELRRIPIGETRTYGEIARALGQPQAQRAVGHACATNPIAVVVPCHRVVRGDGQVGGYRWGSDRKQRLIDREVSRKGS